MMSSVSVEAAQIKAKLDDAYKDKSPVFIGFTTVVRRGTLHIVVMRKEANMMPTGDAETWTEYTHKKVTLL